MTWLRTILAETYAIFVDDGSFALAIIVWCGLVAAAAFLLHALVVWLAPLLAAGLALILLVSVRRRARRG